MLIFKDNYCNMNIVSMILLQLNFSVTLLLFIVNFHVLDLLEGLYVQVVELLIRKLESETSFHRKVDLFFLVDSITQCSHNHKGESIYFIECCFVAFIMKSLVFLPCSSSSLFSA